MDAIDAILSRPVPLPPILRGYSADASYSIAGTNDFVTSILSGSMARGTSSVSSSVSISVENPLLRQHEEALLHQSAGPMGILSSAALQARAVGAYHDETLHDKVQKAKFKSVAQHMPYEQFQEMVRGAHLNPVNLSSSPLDCIVDAGMARRRAGATLSERDIQVADADDAVTAVTAQGSVSDGHGAAGSVLSLPSQTRPRVAATTSTSSSSSFSSSSSSQTPHFSSLDALLSRAQAQATSTSTSAASSLPAASSSSTAVTTPSTSTVTSAIPTWQSAYGIQAPRSQHELESEWIRAGANKASRYAVIRSVAPSQLSTLFQGALGYESLATLITGLSYRLCASPASTAPSADSAQPSLSDPLTPADASHAFGLLLELSNLPRFSMALAFLEPEDKHRAGQVLQALHAFASSMPEATPASTSTSTSTSSTTTTASTVMTSSKKSLSSSSSSYTSAVSSLSGGTEYPMMLPGWSEGDLATFGSADGSHISDEARMSGVDQPDHMLSSSTSTSSSNSLEDILKGMDFGGRGKGAKTSTKKKAGIAGKGKATSAVLSVAGVTDLLRRYGLNQSGA